MKIVSVFGSASPRPGDADYEQAEMVGTLLAKAGFAVATGGYYGTMEAVSKGASEAGGHVIGITCDAIEAEYNIKPNQWVAEEVRIATLRERIIHIARENQGILVLPGGVGTLVEMSMAWNMLMVGELSPRPLVLLGDLWQQTLTAFVQPEYVQQHYVDMAVLVDSPVDAAAFLVESLK